ncbi:MAG: HAMP domain-containing histidine kinase [Desulfobacterales bacterium]|nr:HAMP domain-containing histidine kinase [Desulfobacterales bacterium]
MNKRNILFFLSLLLIPTIIIGIAAFKLLINEQNRINENFQSSARERAKTISQSLQLTVSAVEDELLSALLKIPISNLYEELSLWETSNPLIRNSFVWDNKKGLFTKPLKESGFTKEEERFISRYLNLFSTKLILEQNIYNPNDISLNLSKKYPSIPKNFLNLSRTNKIQTKNYQGNISVYGWLPWFSENRLYILGWVLMEDNSMIYGVELELMSLLSRLIEVFPSQIPEGMIFAIVDDSGKILHRAGRPILSPNLNPYFTVSLAPILPHWEIAVYLTNEESLIGTSTGFIILSGLLLAIFCIFIILGGVLLALQAHKNMIEAMQKSTFVSNVSHELKTPLTSIRMYAELLIENRIKDESKKKDYLKVIVDESHRLTRLVNNILDFSRLERNSKKYNLSKFNLIEFLSVIIKNYKLPAQKAGVSLIGKFPSQEIIVNIDRDALEQSLINLIDNALKYASMGKKIDVEAKIKDNFCKIKVMDRGPGIPIAFREKIFEKFQRINNSLTSGIPGTGLGLSIAKKLMQDLNGNLIYESREGGGSIFTIILPFIP